MLSLPHLVGDSRNHIKSPAQETRSAISTKPKWKKACQHTVAELGEMRQPLSAAVAGIAKLLRKKQGS